MSTKMINVIPLDSFDKNRPEEMDVYLAHNGWHFNKKMCDFAVSKMRKRNPSTKKTERIEPYSKDQVDELLTKYGVLLENSKGYDYVYEANKCKADFLKSSITDEAHLALYIQDVIDDVDAPDGMVMRMWYATMVASGTPIEWSDML